MLLPQNLICTTRKLVQRQPAALIITMFMALGAAPVLAQAPRQSVTPWSERTNVRAPQIPPVQSQAAKGPVLAGPSGPGSWTALGPAPLNSNSPNAFVSGRIAAIATHPTDANTIYIAAAGGGVWKTTSGGSNWI